MKTRDFATWFQTFQKSISNYEYYTDFNKVYGNVKKVSKGLDKLSSLVGSNNIEKEFVDLLNDEDVLNCIPLLLAVRNHTIPVLDKGTFIEYDFTKKQHDNEQYITFMKETGLFKLLAENKISSLIDYITGIEVGLDSHARKSRGGKLMESLVEEFIKETGHMPHNQMKTTDIEKVWGIDLSALTNSGNTVKKFDFVVKTENHLYLFEVNFYNAGGSKLNETARSYKMIALQTQKLEDVTFIWCTDGNGWESAKNNLQETFDVLDDLYNIQDLNNGCLFRLLK